MARDLDQWICAQTGAAAARQGDRIQQLWSGYGEIRRVHLEGAAAASVILKRVDPPGAGAAHPRGWASDRSHQRKLRSYQVELAWYRDHAARCGAACRVPAFVAGRETAAGWEFLLEDLDAAGFAGRRRQASRAEVLAALRWLAALHATFLGDPGEGLWPVGTYWHLDTRPDELAAMQPGRLRDAAAALDARLASARYRTLVHGDAKLANFCFPEGDPGGPVAAVDFQYVGGGVGVQDVAYLLSSAWGEDGLEREAPSLLEAYFGALREALDERGRAQVVPQLEAEWRDLYPVAWADFCRFLQGWAPGHGKLHGYSGRLSTQALETLGA